MILLDMSQVMIANLMVQMKHIQKQQIEEGLMRHMVLNSIRGYRKSFSRKTFGELVLCCDDYDYWRKDVFPYYKANRKKARDESVVDWNAVFASLHKIRDEIAENIPIPVIKYPRAEADDVIAALTHHYGVHDPNAFGVERILILSGDKDFMQLQQYANVEQYSPVTKKFIRIDNPERYLREHIMLGDRGDGVPNFLSDDTCLVDGRRQKSVPRASIEEWSKLKPEDFCDEAMLRGYKRNEMLINLNNIPDDIQLGVVETYRTYTLPPRYGVLPYFMQHRLKNLTEVIGDFL